MRSKYSKQNTNKQTKTNKYKVNTYAKSLQTTKYRQRVVPSKKKDYKPVEQEGKLMTDTTNKHDVTSIKITQRQIAVGNDKTLVTTVTIQQEDYQGSKARTEYNFYSEKGINQTPLVQVGDSFRVLPNYTV